MTRIAGVLGLAGLAACAPALAFQTCSPNLPTRAAQAGRSGTGAMRLNMAAVGDSARMSKREALRQLLGAAVGGVALATAPEPARAATAGIAGARADLAALVKAEPDWGPTLVRLAWHSSGTYDKMSKTGGSGKGTMRFTEELKHGANAGLDKAVAKLEPIKAKHPDVSYADLYALSGAVAIETLGGPKVGFSAGRKDSMDPKDVTPDGRLPDADKVPYACRVT